MISQARINYYSDKNVDVTTKKLLNLLTHAISKGVQIEGNLF
jgi:hypothetical protein